MSANVPQALLKQARKNGVLNLPNQSLKEVPNSVWAVNQPPSNDESVGAFNSEDRWWEYVELTKLNLASNELAEISEQLENFPRLTVFDLHDNNLTSLPNAFSKLENLRRIDLSHNLLTIMPQFESFKSMTVLLLQHNRLEKLRFFENASSSTCELLDLSHNQLTFISELINVMTNLRTLNLSNNQLTSLPAMNNLQSLSQLNLDNNKLKLLPNGFNSLRSLKQLYLKNNQLESLPDLQHCSQLVEIYLGNNCFKMIPMDLPMGLMILELRNNKITFVPDNIVVFSKLERLDIANNDISKLAPEIGNMSLKVLVLDGNPLRSIRSDIIKRGTQAVLKHLKSRIVVEDNSAGDGFHSALPQSSQTSDLHRMHELAASCKLNVSKESVESVERKLAEASNIALREFHAVHCALTSFPQALVEYRTSLTTLNLSFCKLSSISSSIALLTCLSHINFSNNCLASLPDEMAQLTRLHEINISNNRFTIVPSCLYKVDSLENLLADGNQIGSLDVAGLRNISNLALLSLQNNSIAQVPPELVLIKKLQTLKLEGNVFRVPRQGIVQKGSAAVIEYLRSRIPA